MQEGERNPVGDSAASSVARHAAISAALEASENESGAEHESSAETNVRHQPRDNQDAGDQGEQGNSDASQGQTDEAFSAENQLSAPKNWPKDRQDEFNALPDPAKQILLAREKEYSEGIRKNGETNADHRKRSEAITEILKPYEADLQKAGLDYPAAVKWMVDERAAFNRDPIGFLLNYAKQSNYSAEKVVQSLIERAGLTQDQLSQGKQPSGQKGNEQGGADPDDWQDPDILELRTLNEALKGEIKALKESFGQFQQSHTQRESITLQEEVQTFRSAKDDGGNSLRPHYDQLIPIMQQLMNTDPDIQNIPDWKAQAKLQAAYDKAIWLHPETRQAAIDAQVNSQVRSQTNQAEVNKAKQAATRRGSPGANGQAQQGAMTRMEAVAAALREFG